jgi:FAD/FMN-containing dehydrogenase
MRQSPPSLDRREVQIPYFKVQIADFSSVAGDVAMSPSTKGGAMTAPTTLQIPGFRGGVIAPDHERYDDARAVWNGSVDRRPRLIARCSGTADVAAAVRFARDRDLEIAVRGGGYNVAGTAVCDDGIVIDLSAMRAVTVDPVDRMARVQGGSLWGDVDHKTQGHVWPPQAAS